MPEKKVCYVSADNYLDTDIQIVKHICTSYSFTWFVVFSRTFSGFSQEYINKYSKENNIKTKTLKLRFRFRSPRIIFQYIDLLKEIKNEKPDIIYINMLGYPYLFPLILLFIGRKKTIYAIHDFIEHINFKNRFIIRIYQRFIFILFKNFHLYSKEQYILFNKTYKNKNTFLAPQCLKDFGSSNVHPPKDIISFLFFGIIRENKGLEYLILSANKLASTYKGRFKVSIAGPCDNWEKYLALIECRDVFELDIQVIMNEKIPDYFKSAHYLVLPYLDVTQSGVLLIAYNYGTPIIASNHSWFKSYIKDDENGYLFESGNYESLYEIMEKIILSKNKKYNFLKTKLTRFINTTISHQVIVDEYINYFNRI